MSNTAASSQTTDDVLFSATTERIDQLYRSKIEALELNIKTINQILDWIKTAGSALAIGLAMLGWWFGNSYSSATENAQKAASSAFERQFFKNTENAKDFSELKTKYDSAISSLQKIEKDLKGYAELRNVIGNVENFDPLELYASLDKEIDYRYEKSSSYGDPNNKTNINETVFDPPFRQKSAFVFDRLLKAVKDDAKNGKPKVEVVTLFNAAANASKMDMDFVSLELMEAANSLDKSKSPENSARLIRQRLTMSRITSEEAIQAIQEIITNTRGFQFTHVLSEAFNIGIKTAQPVRIARIMTEKTHPALWSTSFSKLIAARLYLMGETSKDWDEGEKLFNEGIDLIKNEPSSVPWRKESMREARQIMKKMQDS